MIRIVIADDHPIFRRGLRELLENEPDFEVVAEAEDADSARRYVRGHHPDVLVIDLNMPGEAVLDVLPDLRSEFSDTEIVVLTMQNEPAYARRALQDGALGYVLKDAAAQELVTAVRAAVRGESFLNPRLGAKLASESTDGAPGGLSDRELQVMSMLALGYTNAQIAEQLYISVRTVETHRAHLQQKLGVTDRRGLVAYAFQNGLVDPTA
ncbi:response regulator transcription factor [Conexibacter sp. DBS9H8]|uniref:response regulator n=1 Tax=Conexibacter sp. DBS9H8 TaxID=2937801 RepID=UPI00200BD4DA|nr:response regulator transcription factor [Conexibacter sp. DBS9H8]